MSLTTSEMTPADIRACTCGNDGYGNGNGWGGDWSSWIIVFLIFAAFGGNGWGFGGGFGGGGNGALTRADLAAEFDFNGVENGIRGIQQGLCDGFYAMNTGMLNGFANIVNNTNQGFAGLNTALITNGYETRNAINQLAAQEAACCCDLKGAIKDDTTAGVMNTNAIQRQISDCCCDIEKSTMQTRFDMQQYNCNTLTAIDRLGDRIIDYMSANERQALRDENQTLRLAASQAAQNNYLVQQLRPCPTPAYVVPNPYCCTPTPTYTCGGGCGC